MNPTSATCATFGRNETTNRIHIMEVVHCRVKKGGDSSRRVIFFKDKTSFYKATTDLSVWEDIHEGNVMNFDPVPIPMDHIFPTYVTSLTRAPPQVSDLVYVKKPSFLSYSPSERHQVPIWFLQEAHVLEALSKSPHQNIVKYLGCIVEKGRIEGICLERCNLYLHARLGFENDQVNKEEVLHGLKKAVSHLHHLGYCHNDISPYNVLFRDDDSVVLIDFDACRPVGQTIGKEVSFGFCDRTSLISKPENDFFSIAKMEEYLATGVYPKPR